MKFEYPEWTTDKGEVIAHPLIPVTLKYKKRSTDIYALIDSGAAHCVAPSYIGERLLGISVNRGRKDKTQGISGRSVTIYYHDVQIIVGRIKIKTQIGFGKTIPMVLLGQKGFFDQFKVVLDRRSKVIEIIK